MPPASVRLGLFFPAGGRKLEPVPEQHADAGSDPQAGILSDEEPQPARRGRSTRRLSAPAAGAAPAAVSGGSRRRSAAAAVDSEDTTPVARTTRRSSRN